MSKLIFKDLYLFSPSEKLAKKISFAPGRTMITSDAHDGTDRGKSVIMKLIVSGLGFSGDEILDSFDSIITLTNNKYELLCQKDYDANVSLLRELNNK